MATLAYSRVVHWLWHVYQWLGWARRDNHLAVFVLLGLVGQPAWAGAATEEDLKASFLSEAPGGWAHYRSLAQHLQGTATRSWFDVTEGRTELPTWTKVTFRQGGQCAVLWGEDINSKAQRSRFAYAVNSRYAFELSAKSEYAWRITELAIFPNEEPPRDVTYESIANRIATWTCSNLRLYDMWLSDLLADKGFVIRRVSLDPDANQEKERVEFEYTPPKASNESVRGGVFHVDPARGWVLTDYQLVWHTPNGEQGTMTCRFEYANSTPAFPVLRGNVLRVDSDKKHKEIRVDNELTIGEEIPEKECTLTAFGLAEPKDISWDRRRGRWILVAGTVLLSGAALLLYSYSRRSKKTARADRGENP